MSDDDKRPDRLAFDSSHHQRVLEMNQDNGRVDTWFWRIFYAAIAIIVSSGIALIAGVVWLGLHFDEILEFIRTVAGVL